MSRRMKLNTKGVEGMKAFLMEELGSVTTIIEVFFL